MLDKTQIDEPRINELLVPFLGAHSLSPIQTQQVSTYLEMLLRWNAKINLTAVRDPQEIITRHFGESFFAARNLFPSPDQAHGTAIDIGSGAGFPGLPMKILAPAINLRLIEANQRKATFLREVARALKLQGVSVLAQRAENVNATADLVSLRAVESFEKTLPIARQLLTPRGRLALLIGSEQLQTAMSLLSDLAWKEPMPIPLSHNRILAIGCLT